MKGWPQQVLVKVDKITGKETVIKKGRFVGGTRIGLAARGDPHVHYYVVSRREWQERQEAARKALSSESPNRTDAA